MHKIMLLEDDASLIDGLEYTLKKNDFERAKEFLTKAFELAPTNRDIKEHLLKLDKSSYKK